MSTFDRNMALVKWGKKHFRELPWRQTSDPYSVLIAELMLHRTVARQVVPIYEKFLDQYPDIKTLAAAPHSTVYAMLHPLGLKWRVDALIKMTSVLVEQHRGKIPEDRESLVALPGVSDYIASAVRRFAYGYADPIVDTNTVRIVGRVYGMQVRDSSRRSNKFKEKIEEFDSEGINPQKVGFALLDLANLVCLARKPPKCNECPIRAWCEFGKSSKLGELRQ
jgi:A/G-specific adenine glycosylase